MAPEKRKRVRKPKNVAAESGDDGGASTVAEEDAVSPELTETTELEPPTRRRGSSGGRAKKEGVNEELVDVEIAASREGRGHRAMWQNVESTVINSDSRQPAEAAAVAAATAAAKAAPWMDAVVKVFCVHSDPNFSLPWQRKRQYSSSSSGFIIGENRVLTNAHSVEHQTQVRLKKRGSDTKYLANILAIGTECDIGSSLFIRLHFCSPSFICRCILGVV